MYKSFRANTFKLFFIQTYKYIIPMLYNFISNKLCLSRKVGFVIILLSGCCNLSGQQHPLYSQYLMNYHLINPAIAGSSGIISLDITARKQWLGFTGAPYIYTISGQTRLFKRPSTLKKTTNNTRLLKKRSGKVGLGGYVFNVINGAVEKTGAQFSYAYHIHGIGGRYQLSFGLSGSFYQLSMNKAKIHYLEVETGDVLGSLNNTYIIPDAGVGVYLLSPDLHLGFSANQLFQEYLPYLVDFNLYRNYYIMGGYKFRFLQDTYIEPSVILKINENKINKSNTDGIYKTPKEMRQNTIFGLQSELDINLKAFINKDFWIGMGYRSRGTTMFFTGIKTHEKFMIVYAAGFPFGKDINQYSTGSHELMVSYVIGGPGKRRDQYREYY